MLSLELALEQLLKNMAPVAEVEKISAGDAAGRFVAEDVTAPNPLPMFDNSAMDGWAVHSAEVRGASPNSPIQLTAVATIPAGQAFEGEVVTGQCVRIFTGSPLPLGADAVVMQEDCREEGSTVFVMDAVKPWENVRIRGEDVKVGAVLGRRGDRVIASMAGASCACGVREITVFRKIRVAVLATGSELKEPGEAMAHGEIFESNRVLIASALREIGIEPIVLPIVRDDLRGTVEAIRRACEADAVITCGGVSVGEFDFVKEGIVQLGGALNFWRVAIKPGKPFLFANVLGKPLFGLPGNPVSAFVTFFLLARPALLRMAGAADVRPVISFGELGEEISNRGDRRQFVRVVQDAEGIVRVSGPQASHRIGSLAAANGLLDVPAETKLEAGQRVRVIRIS